MKFELKFFYSQKQIYLTTQKVNIIYLKSKNSRIYFHIIQFKAFKNLILEPKLIMD